MALTFKNDADYILHHLALSHRDPQASLEGNEIALNESAPEGCTCVTAF